MALQTTELSYFPLVSNIDSLKDRLNEKGKTLQSKDSEISIAVKKSDLFGGVENPVFYAERYGMVYNPDDNFSPNIAGAHAITGRLVEDYWNMLDKAKYEYKRLLNEFKKPNGGGDNSGELEELKRELAQKQDRINEQTAKIAQLVQARKENENKGQTEQLKAMIDSLAAIQNNRIEIVINGKTKKVIEKILHESFADIVSLLSVDEAVYLYGPAGTGKSQLAKDISEALDLKFYPASTITQEYKLTGFTDAGGTYHAENFYRAMKFGGLFFLDEMDSCASEVLVGINGALANGYFDFPGETVYAHENFRVIAAGNTIGRGAADGYEGRNALDISTLDRFLAVELNYSPAIDNAVANGDSDLVEFAHEVRRAAENCGVIILCSYRSISKINKLQGMNRFSLKDILKMALIKGIASDDIRQLARNMNIDSSNKYYTALKQAA